MIDIVVVDWKNICKICSYSILSGSVACCYSTEPDEIAHRIVKRMFCIRADNPDANLIIASDKAPYWRHKFINKWYNDRGLEPIGYKSNRSSMSWPFASSKETLDDLYAHILNQVCNCLDAICIQDVGLEADDVWGIIASSEKEKTVQGITSDSDWQQLCGNNITVLNPVTNEIIIEPADIRAKCIAGDRGDNVLGCNKKRKDGSPGATMWGIDGAKKLIATHTESEWSRLVDWDTYTRNYDLIKLPCPLWNLEEAVYELGSIIKNPINLTYEESTKILDTFGVTEPVRKLLSDKAERSIWISKLRAYLQEKNAKKAEKSE